MFSPCFLLTLAAEAGDPVAWYLSAPRPEGLSLDLDITEGSTRSRAVLDVRTQAGATAIRAEVTSGPRAGQAALVQLGAPGQKDRLYAYKPELGTAAATWAQLERNFHAVGVSLADLVDLLLPARAGTWTGSAEGAGATLRAPADSAGCSDVYTFTSMAVPVPAQVRFCPAEPWAARESVLSGVLRVGEAVLPAAIRTSDGRRTVSVNLALAATERWLDPARFDRASLGR